MAYTRLLRAYYHHERGIPEGQAYRLARASTPAQKRAVDVVLAEFFVLANGEHTQKRADEEVERFRDKQRKAKASADARWAHTERKADAMRTHSEGNALQSPDTRPIEETSKLSLAPARIAYEPPDCPHQEVIALWAEVLPSMPQHLAHEWKGARADHLRVRWRETATLKRWEDKAAGLLYLRKLFAHIGRSAFLTGRARAKPGERPFVIELEWLVNPTNWAKVHEGKYHQDAA